MCDLYSITTNQATIIALFRVINRYVGNLPPMPGVFPDYPAPVGAQRRYRARADHDAMGHAAATEVRRTAGHQDPQHVVASLAGLAQARKPLPGPRQMFFGIRTEPNLATGKKDLVWFALNDDRPLFAFAGIWR